MAAGSYALKHFIDAKNAQQHVLGQDKTVLGKEGDLDTAAADIHDHGPFLNDAVEFLTL